MLRSFMTFIIMLLTFFPATGLAEEVASAFRYPITTNGLNQGSSYTISQGYHNSGGHDGIDFAYSLGDPIYAVANGTVVASAEYGTDNDGDGVSDTSWGNLVRIRHLMPNGSYRYSQYAHLTSRWVASGDTVSYGQQIGTMGSTGNSTGPHLHFQIITTDMSGCGYYPSSTCGLNWSEDQYWSTFIDPITFLDDRLGEAETSTASVHLFTIEPNSSNKFDLYGYEVSGSGESTTLSGDYFSYLNTGSTTTILSWLSADVDNDGWDDVIRVRTNNGYTYANVYLSNGEGGLTTQTRWKQTSGTATNAFLNDIDGDGYPDLILAFANSDSTLTWKYFLGTGSGFSDVETWSTSFGTTTSKNLVGDFNGNGEAEAFAGAGSTLTWQRLNSTGSVTTLNTSWGLSTDEFVVANTDSDVSDEIVRIDERDSSVEVEAAHYNHSAGTLTITVMGADVGGDNGSYAIYSLDYLDGYADLIRSNGTTLYLARNNAGSSFEQQTDQSSLLTGLNLTDDQATFVFGNFGVRTSTTIQAIDGNTVDPDDDEEVTWDYTSQVLTNLASADYADLSSSVTCAVDAEDSLYVVLNGQDGRIYEFESTNDGVTWSSSPLTSLAAVPLSAPGTTPHLFIDPDTGDRYVTFMGINARINLFHYNGTSWSAVELTSVVAAPLADITSSPYGYIANGVIYVVFQGNDQRIWWFTITNGTTYGSLDLTGRASVQYAMPGTSPMGIYNEITGEHHIVFQGINQRIQRLTYNGSTWSSVEITSVINSDLLDQSSNPYTYVDPFTGYVYTVINGVNERIDLIADYHTSWDSDELTSLVSVPLTEPGSSPTGYIDPFTGNHVITLQGDNGRINQFEGPPWTSIDLTSQASVEYAASATSPGTCVDPFSGVRHTAFVGDNGRVQYLRYGP